MDSPSFLYVLIGALILVSRAPLIFAPHVTLRYYQRQTSTDAKVRVLGILFVPIAIAALMISPGDDVALLILHAFGWVFGLAALWLLAGPRSFRNMLDAMIDIFDERDNELFLRLIGVVAAAVGIAMIHAGFYIV